MENENALKLIKKIQSDLIADGLVVENIVPELQKLREFALLEEKPVLVKSIRLTYEHIQNNNAFLIAIPSDEAIEETEGAETAAAAAKNDLESLQYLLSLYKDINNKHNIEDLRDYNARLLAF